MWTLGHAFFSMAEGPNLHCLFPLTPPEGYFPHLIFQPLPCTCPATSVPALTTAPKGRAATQGLQGLGNATCSPLCRVLQPYIFAGLNLSVELYLYGPLCCSILFHLLPLRGWFVPESTLRDIFLCIHRASVFQGHFTHRKSCFCFFPRDFYQWKSAVALHSDRCEDLWSGRVVLTLSFLRECVLSICIKGKAALAILPRYFTSQCYDGSSVQICEAPIKR